MLHSEIVKFFRFPFHRINWVTSDSTAELEGYFALHYKGRVSTKKIKNKMEITETVLETVHRCVCVFVWNCLDVHELKWLPKHITKKKCYRIFNWVDDWCVMIVMVRWFIIILMMCEDGGFLWILVTNSTWSMEIRWKDTNDDRILMTLE